jgi:hypothetical protein
MIAAETFQLLAALAGHPSRAERRAHATPPTPYATESAPATQGNGRAAGGPGGSFSDSAQTTPTK